MALQDLTPQLRTRLRKVEWFVVLFLGGTFVLMSTSLAWFIKKAGDARGWWVTEVPYYTYLPDATGIKIGSPVQMIGFKIGQVTKVEAVSLADLRSWDYYGKHPVFVGFNVREPYPGYITSDSRLKLAGIPIEIAGGVTLELTVGSVDGLLTTTNGGGRLSVLSDRLAYDELAGKTITNLHAYARYTPLADVKKGFFLRLNESDTMMAQVQRILAKVDGISGKVDGALPDLTRDLKLSLSNVATLTDKLKPALSNPGGIGRLLLPTNLVARFDQTGGIGELLLPAQLNTELTATLRSLRETVPGAVSNLNERTASLGPLLTNLTAGTTNLGHLMTNLDDTLGGVKSNTLPKVDSLLGTLDSFVAGLKRHWLFRSGFKPTPAPAPPATNAPAPAPRRGARKF